MEKLKNDVLLIQEIGEKIGYGYMMLLASALWKKKLSDSGGPVSGAYVPTCELFIKDEFKDTVGNEFYDQLINKYAK